METCAEEQGHKMVLGMSVSAENGSYKEERHFFDTKAAFGQYDLFKEVGYKKVEMCPGYFVHEEGEWHPVRVEAPVLIESQAVPARWTRTNFNPGIGLRKYEREVLQRPRMTGAELLVSVMIGLLIFFVPLVVVLNIPAQVIMVKLGRQDVMAPVLLAMGAGYAIVMFWWMGPIMRKVDKFVGIPSVEEWRAD